MLLHKYYIYAVISIAIYDTYRMNKWAKNLEFKKIYKLFQAPKTDEILWKSEECNLIILRFQPRTMIIMNNNDGSQVSGSDTPKSSTPKSFKGQLAVKSSGWQIWSY